MESESQNPEFRINPELSPMEIPSNVSNRSRSGPTFCQLIWAQTACKI